MQVGHITKLPRLTADDYKKHQDALDHLDREWHRRVREIRVYYMPATLAVTCAVYGVTEEEIYSSSRANSLTQARRHLCWHLRHYAGAAFTTGAIAKIIKRNDHSTVVDIVKAFDPVALRAMVKHVDSEIIEYHRIKNSGAA